MVSFDVKALFTSVPIQPAITIIKRLLEEDQSLQQRTTMSVNNITCLLEFCLKSTYFTYQGKHFEQLVGSAMGPHQPNCCQLIYGEFWRKCHKYSSTPSLLLEEICWWHIYHLRVITKKSLPGSHQLYWPAHPVYLWRTSPWCISDT